MRSFLPLALLALLWTSHSRAQELFETTPERPAPHLTSEGRWLVSGTIGGFWSNDTSRALAYPSWWITAQPSLLYFLRERIGLGGFLTYGASKYSFDTRTSQYGLGLGAAFDIALSPRTSLMLRPRLGFVRQVWETHPRAPSSINPVFPELTTSLVRLDVDASLLFHMSDSVAFGFGPNVWHDFFIDGGGRTQIGLSSNILASF